MKFILTLLALSFLAACSTPLSKERLEEIKEERFQKRIQPNSER